MSFFRPKPLSPGPGQESVWDYPRPAIGERTNRLLRVEFAGEVIAETRNGVRTLETSHPPTYYFPPEDVKREHLHPTGDRSLCEWKGQAHYFDVVVSDRTAPQASWFYPNPTQPFQLLSGHFAFYPALMDACFVDGERVEPQPGGFYGGWVTRDLTGPFKGGPGSMGW